MPSNSESYGSSHGRADTYSTDDRDAALGDCNAEDLLARFTDFTADEGVNHAPDGQESRRFQRLLRGDADRNDQMDGADERHHDRAMGYAAARLAPDQEMLSSLKQEFEQAVEEDNPSGLHGPLGSPANFQEGWQQEIQKRLDDADLSLEVSRRLVYVGLIARDEYLVGNGMMLADDALLALDEQMSNPDDAWVSDMMIEGLVDGSDINRAVHARVSFIRNTADTYGPSTDNAEAWEEGAARRLVADCVAGRDLAWAADRFREGFGSVDGPPELRSLLDDMGERMVEVNQLFRLTYAGHLVHQDGYRLRETVNTLEHAGSWPAEAAEALDKDIHYTWPETFAEDVASAMVWGRDYIEQTLNQDGEHAAELSAIHLHDRVRCHVEEPFIVPVMAYCNAAAEEARVLMAQPGWSEHEDSRERALRAYSLAQGAQHMRHGLSGVRTVEAHRSAEHEAAK